MATFKTWLETSRPKTLPLAAASIITGCALAAWAGQFRWSVAFFCFLTTFFLQILSNFANDYGDFQKGSDTAERVGPLRGIQKGQMSATQLKKGIWVMIRLSFVSGAVLLWLAYQTPWDIAVFFTLGILSIIAAITYTVGRKPYGYLGLGDVSVVIFFGFVGVCGTFYLQSHYFSWATLLPALGAGLLAAAVLNINNLRDVVQDEKAGKTTLVVRLGVSWANRYHDALLIGAMLSFIAFALLACNHWYNFSFIVVYPFLIKHLHSVHSVRQGEGLRPMLGQMAMLALLTNALFSFSIIWA